MAKKSSIEKNNRRRKLAKSMSGRRARLKAIARDKDKAMEERFAASLKLAELPRNSSRHPHPQSLRGDRPSARLLSQAQDEPHRAPGTGLEGPDSRPREVELVRGIVR